MTADTAVVSPLCAGADELRLVYLLEPRAVALKGPASGDALSARVVQPGDWRVPARLPIDRGHPQKPGSHPA